MRIIKSISKNTLNDHIVSKEPLTNAYVSVVPTKSSLYTLLNWLRASHLGTTLFSKDNVFNNQELYTFAHVTIIYSKDAAPNVDRPELHAKYQYHPSLTGSISHFEEWPGHDGVGYLVAVLDAPSLCELHEKWKSLGCKHSFEDFVPHLTIVHPHVVGSADVEGLNQRVKEFPVSFEFVNETIVPICES